MPNRILKDSINESKNLSECSFFAQDLYKRLITYADDYGRFNADAQIVLARLYPRDTDIINHNDIITALIELCGVEKIKFYTAEPRGEIYGCLPNWCEHQRVRDSKKKCPEPNDTSINDWYLRMFVPLQIKIQVVERDNFKCQECRVSFKAEDLPAKKLIKLGAGLIHFDHIVPVNQGGRATTENLRLLCAKCNLSRKRFFTYNEILQFAASCGKFPQEIAEIKILPPNPIQTNPIQSESNPNPKGETHIDIINNFTDNDLLKKALTDYLDMRKTIKKPATNRALQLVLKTLEPHVDSIKIKMLEQSVIKNWTDVYLVKDEQPKSYYRNLSEA